MTESLNPIKLICAKTDKNLNFCINALAMRFPSRTLKRILCTKDVFEFQIKNDFYRNFRLS